MDKLIGRNMRKVMIGTPCYDGRLDVWYVNSLMETLKLAQQHDVEIIPIWVSFDALIQRARNDTVHLALEMGVDDLIWIDSDIEWKPSWFYRLLEIPEDVVGGTYPKKSDVPTYVLRQTTPHKIDPATRMMEVDALGTGFVKMSARALRALWDSSKSYIDPKDDKERRLVFDVVAENNVLISEDINAFMKLSRAGFKIWLDTTICCNHIGGKKYTGNFTDWWLNIRMSMLPSNP
jgi:hypothetical protein